MKLLTKKKQSEMLQRLAANHIIAANAINKLGETTEMSVEEYADAMEHLIDNTCRLSEMVGGISAMVAVKEMVDSKSHLIHKIGNEMKFNSQICTSREQSERLLSLGLKKETADCCYYYYDGEYLIAFAEDAKYPSDIPAWSLHRLIELCSQQIYVGKRKYFHTLHLINNEYVAYIDDIGDAYQYHDERDLYNSLISCIEWLIKEGYFNKEYLV